MTLSDLAALGSLVSGAAVVLTLVLLLLQIRQTNRNQRATVQQNRVTRSAEFILRGIDPSIVPAWMQGAEGDPQIGPERHWQFITLMRTFFLGLEDTYFQHRLGLVDDGTLVGVRRLMCRHFAAPGVRAAWRQLRDVFDPGFALYCDEIVREGRISKNLVDFTTWQELVEQEKRERAD
jgi:hypothetical protein